MSVTTEIIDAINAPTYEPQKRMVAGRYTWAKHRFPIKGGISFRETMIRDLYSAQNSTWLEMFKTMNTPVFSNDQSA